MYLPRLSLAPTFLRELVCDRTLPREPESQNMDEGQQVRAFAETGREQSTLAASYLFHTARVTQVIKGCRSVLDLGCGPGTQLAQIASINPDVEFIGMDISPNMLASARAHVSKLGLKNVRFVKGDVTRLAEFKDHSVDGVISTATLHHLPDVHCLKRCFQEIGRVLVNGGAIYLADFGRLKNLKSVLFFAYMNRGRDPHQLLLDYERSLRAAFRRSKFSALAKETLPATVKLYSTFRVPLLVVLKTPDKLLGAEKIEKLNQMRMAIEPRFRRDLDDMRLFFRFGGLREDVFR